MKYLTKINSLYRPIQPTISANQSGVIYSEIPPDSKLKDLIFCYWELKTTTILKEPFYYKVVADGCIDIFFEVNNPSENYVMGFCKNYTEFPLGNSFYYAGVRFYPTIFPILFEIDASEISNRFEQLKIIHPGTSEYIENSILPQKPAIKNAMDKYFLSILSKKRIYEDPRFYEAVYLILQNQGTISIEKELNTGISTRHLRRLFNFYIGDTAKTFSKIVRFQNFLNSKSSNQALFKNSLQSSNDYYDQSHFIKEFKNLYGDTPGKIFKG